MQDVLRLASIVHRYLKINRLQKHAGVVVYTTQEDDLILAVDTKEDAKEISKILGTHYVTKGKEYRIQADEAMVEKLRKKGIEVTPQGSYAHHMHPDLLHPAGAKSTKQIIFMLIDEGYDRFYTLREGLIKIREEETEILAEKKEKTKDLDLKKRERLKRQVDKVINQKILKKEHEEDAFENARLQEEIEGLEAELRDLEKRLEYLAHQAAKIEESTSKDSKLESVERALVGIVKKVKPAEISRKMYQIVSQEYGGVSVIHDIGAWRSKHKYGRTPELYYTPDVLIHGYDGAFAKLLERVEN